MIWGRLCRIISEFITSSFWTPILRQPLVREATNQSGQSWDLISLSPILRSQTTYISGSAHITLSPRDDNLGHILIVTGVLARLLNLPWVLSAQIAPELTNFHQISAIEINKKNFNCPMDKSGVIFTCPSEFSIICLNCHLSAVFI